MHLTAKTTFNSNIPDWNGFFGKKMLGAINTAPHKKLIGR